MLSCRGNAPCRGLVPSVDGAGLCFLWRLIGHRKMSMSSLMNRSSDDSTIVRCPTPQEDVNVEPDEQE